MSAHEGGMPLTKTWEDGPEWPGEQTGSHSKWRREATCHGAESGVLDPQVGSSAKGGLFEFESSCFVISLVLMHL